MNIEQTAWQINEIDDALIELALIEDLGKDYTDLTCQALFNQDILTKRAQIMSKHPTPITICGLALLDNIMNRMAFDYECRTTKNDGATLQPQETLVTLLGPAHGLLKLERTLLNFLRHLCGVATLTAHFVEAVKGTGLKILDTRKTTPGMRHLEKYAVASGGGVNHRMGLYDAIMIKDTHIDLMGGVEPVFAKLPTLAMTTCAVIIEVRTPDELQAALHYGKNKISRILLDNMPPDLMKDCVPLCKEHHLETEASGNITLSNIKEIAASGVDYASIGMLTHSAGQVDLSMKI